MNLSFPRAITRYLTSDHENDYKLFMQWLSPFVVKTAGILSPLEDHDLRYGADIVTSEEFHQFRKGEETRMWINILGRCPRWQQCPFLTKNRQRKIESPLSLEWSLFTSLVFPPIYSVQQFLIDSRFTI